MDKFTIKDSVELGFEWNYFKPSNKVAYIDVLTIDGTPTEMEAPAELTFHVENVLLPDLLAEGDE